MISEIFIYVVILGLTKEQTHTAIDIFPTMLLTAINHLTSGKLIIWIVCIFICLMKLFLNIHIFLLYGSRVAMYSSYCLRGRCTLDNHPHTHFLPQLNLELLVNMLFLVWGRKPMHAQKRTFKHRKVTGWYSILQPSRCLVFKHWYEKTAEISFFVFFFWLTKCN